MGFLAAKLIVDAGKYSVRNPLVYALAEVVMIGGYFIFESFVNGVALAAGSLFPNFIQGCFGVVIGVVLSPIVRRVFTPKN